VGERPALRMTIGIFHAVCHRVVRRHARRAGRTPVFSVYDKSASGRLVRRALADLGVADPAPALAALQIGQAKARLLTPTDYRAAARQRPGAGDRRRVGALRALPGPVGRTRLRRPDRPRRRVVRGAGPRRPLPGAQPDPSVPALALAVRPPAEREVLIPLDPEQVVEGMRQYQQLLRDLLEPSDWQPRTRTPIRSSGRSSRSPAGARSRAPSTSASSGSTCASSATRTARRCAPRSGSGRSRRTASTATTATARPTRAASSPGGGGRSSRTTCAPRPPPARHRRPRRHGEVSAEEIAPAGEEEEHARALAAGAPASEELARVAFAALGAAARRRRARPGGGQAGRRADRRRPRLPAGRRRARPLLRGDSARS
jgi:hypothetical protein